MKEKQPFKAPGHESFPIKKLKAKRGWIIECEGRG
jgi:hypothetical protein